MQTPIESPLPRERVCSGMARRLVEQHFSSELGRGSLDDLKLVSSELVDNAYIHGQGQIRIKLETVPGAVRVEVMDEGRGAHVTLRRAGVTGGGNGLRLVDHICPRWGSFQGSTHVWAEVPTTAAN